MMSAHPRDRFLAACRCEPMDRPPVWIMRQAGRYLPEYRALKERHSFLEMVRTPELAEEVTLQPLRRFDLDAAILFSDILVVPEALGQGYSFREGGGIAMDYAIRSLDQVRCLSLEGLEARLDYVRQALERLRNTLGRERALLGFAGSPWTLAAYMVEGGGSDTFANLKHLYYGKREVFESLLEVVTTAVIRFLALQRESGADALQLFDSWGGICPGLQYEEMSLRWTRRVLASIPEGFPVILFARGCAQHMDRLSGSGAKVIGMDWTADLAALGRPLVERGLAVQGNLDPLVLETDPETVRREVGRILGSMGRPSRGHIFNLGHGIRPSAQIGCVEALVETVHQFAQDG